MDRRRFLAAATLPLAGCSLPTDAEALTKPETAHEPDRGSYHYSYGPDDEEWARYDLGFGDRETADDAFDLRLGMSGTDHLGITDLRFVVEPGLDVTGKPPTPVRYLAKSWPPVTVDRERLQVVLDVEELDDPVDATLHFTLTVEPRTDVRQALVATEASFTGGGTFDWHTLRESAVYDLPEPRPA